MPFENAFSQSTSRGNRFGRNSFSSTRTASTGKTSISGIVENNNTEAFSGAAVETVPSSIVSFYHPHSFQSSGYGASVNSSNNVDRRGRLSESDSLLLSPTESRLSRSSSRTPAFKFFSEDEIENAEGFSSTLENADYNTEWDAIPTYEQERLHIQPKSSRNSLRHSLNDYALTTMPSADKSSIRSKRRSEIPYSSSPVSSSSSSIYTIRDRIPAELELDATNYESDEDLQTSSSSTRGSDPGSQDVEFGIRSEDRQEGTKKAYHSEFLKPEYHSKFYPDYVPRLHYQRFYIAEEDLVIAIAGFKTARLRLYAYYFLCLFSFGILYLVFRWKPSMKIKMTGKKTPLGKAEWVVVENEFGELSIIEVVRRWYNRPLSTLLVEDNEDKITFADSNQHHHHHQHSETNPNIPVLISFEYRYFTLIFSPIHDLFRSNTNWSDPNWSDLDFVQKGLSSSIQEDRTLGFGKNSVNLKQKTVSQILFDEALHPFYIFQIFSVLLWLADDYYYYAVCIFFISIVSIVDTVVETKKNSERIAEMSQFTCDVRVYKDGFWSQINSSELVPGDIYEVSAPLLDTFPADSILVSGDCIVNESMLTGESVPVSKCPASESTMAQLLVDLRSTQISSFVSKSFLFNGTKIIRVRSQPGQGMALAMVVRTGFSTTKGALIRSMVFPRPVGFKFYEDSFKYIGFMGIVALIGFSISCIQFIRIGLDYKTMILRALDIITIVIPPALPATLTIGTSFALTRLKKKGIFCIAPTRVNVGGKVDIMCFDKTGTLTVDGLEVLGLHVTKSMRHGLELGNLITNCDDLLRNDDLGNHLISEDSNSKNLLLSILTCHSLSHMDGQLLGDPLDLKMFEFTRWAFEEGYENWNLSGNEDHSGISTAVVYPTSSTKFIENDPKNIVGIIRKFEFLSELRRMSVIVKGFKDSTYWTFTKGAPEVIQDLCKKETVPNNFQSLLHYYTHAGYRVIACAGKPLRKNTWLYSQKVSRDEIESNLEFLGFVVFENKLKKSTKEVISVLKKANIRTVMCTGDNILTAVSVGRESGLIGTERIFIPFLNEDSAENQSLIVWQDVDDLQSHLDSVTLRPIKNPEEDFNLAITGDIFRILFRNDEVLPEDYINTVLLKGSIFARMSPDEKHELVERLQKIDYNVGFCGDGANDCGALKAANVGISLSEAEASVAAPFTSNVFDITCVLDVIKEGRASLVTSFSCFQYMSLYSAIQFVTVTILYSRGSNLGDIQFLYIDLLLIVPLAIFMSWSKPNEKLVKKRPSSNLVSPKILVPLCVTILIILVFQLIPWLTVQHTSWYMKPIVAGDEAVASSDNTVLFFVSNFQYILTAVILSQGPPYREPMTRNTGFIVNVLLSVLVSLILMCISPHSRIGNLLQLTNISNSFRWFIVALVAMNYYTQTHVPLMFKHLFKKTRSSKKYKRVSGEKKLSYCV